MIPIPRRSATRAGAVAALCGGMLAVTIALGGCTPGTDPKPTPTPLFTSEADAYRAAEKVFRDYINAVNAEHEDASANPQSFLAGTALDDDIKSVRELAEAKQRITGSTTVTRFRSDSFDVKALTVRSTVCLDVSNTRVLNADGVDITAASRPPVVAIGATMTVMSDSFKIVNMGPSDETCS